MQTLQLYDKEFELFLEPAAIARRVQALAEQIDQDYRGKKPLFLAILNGSFIFASDLFKSLTIEAEICFIKLASYKGTKSSGQIVTAIGLDTDIIRRDVLILEDIVDTGKTLHFFLPQLRNQQPHSLKIAALLHKPDAMVYPVPIDYLGFTIPNEFVVGYGLDYRGLGRNHPGLYRLKIQPTNLPQP